MFERQSSWILIIGLVALSCGGTKSVTYTPEQDQEVLDRLEGTWVADSESGDLRLVLCEDEMRADYNAEESPDECDHDHVVRAQSRSARETRERGSVGCGGCPFDVNAYLDGTVRGGPLPEPIAVEITAEIGDGYDDKPYDPPYFLVGRLETDAPDQSPSMQLEYEGPGELTGVVGGRALDTEYTFSRTTGAAVCE
jgi:hypothetical protein